MAENVFEAVKQSVSTRDAAAFYGIEVKRNGMACCPFHDDKNPSMKLNEEYFYCFGCGATGDVIDFTAKLFDLSPKEAAEKLAQDFGLIYDSQAPPRRRYVRQNKVVHLIQDFVCDDLSNWYIRRNRRRFWGSELDNSKKAVYKTTYEILVGLCKMICPIAPFISEEIYTKLTGEESVNLSDYPVCDESMINESLEEKMDLVIELISYARNIREEAKIKVRQPISEVIFEEKYKEKIGEFESLFKEELNVKNVNWTNDLSKYLTVTYKPNFKEVGKVFGSDIKAFGEYLSNITEDDSKKLESGELTIKLNDKEYEVTPNYVIKTINSKDGYKAVMLNYKTVIINTTLDKDLINEGIAREIVSKVQNLRKTSGFDIADRIDMIYNASKEVVDAVNEFKEYIMDEILALTLEESDKAETEFKINDYDMKVSIKQVK